MLRIDLYNSDRQHINQQLIDQNYADSANESYISEVTQLETPGTVDMGQVTEL